MAGPPPRAVRRRRTANQHWLVAVAQRPRHGKRALGTPAWRWRLRGQDGCPVAGREAETSDPYWLSVLGPSFRRSAAVPVLDEPAAPDRVAIANGVWPRLFSTSSRAPRSTRNSISLLDPLAAARWSAVSPPLLAAFTSPPSDTARAATSRTWRTSSSWRARVAASSSGSSRRSRRSDADCPESIPADAIAINGVVPSAGGD